MDESYAIRRYEQAAALLPLRWQQHQIFRTIIDKALKCFKMILIAS